MSELLCSCACGQIKFEVSNEPPEIAHCYCSICANLAQSELMSFAKYPIKLLDQINRDLIREIRSSNRAVRGYCQTCQSAVYMLYDRSDNIWIATDLFQFPTPNSETYDIYRN